MAVSIYRVTLKADGGRKVTWVGPSSSSTDAKKAATKAENAPMSAIIKVERRNTNGNFNVMDDRKGMSGYNEYVVTMKSDGNVRRKHVVMATSAEDAAKRVADRENAPMRAVVNVEQRKLRR